MAEINKKKERKVSKKNAWKTFFLLPAGRPICYWKKNIFLQMYVCAKSMLSIRFFNKNWRILGIYILRPFRLLNNLNLNKINTLKTAPQLQRSKMMGNKQEYLVCTLQFIYITPCETCILICFRLSWAFPKLYESASQSIF